MKLSITRGLVASAIAAATAVGVGLAPSASANPQATVPLATLSCPDGVTIEAMGIDAPGFLDHSPAALVGGRGIVAHWFSAHDTGTVTIVDGEHAGEVIPFDNTFEGPAGTESRRNPAPDLDSLTRCDSAPEAYTDTGVVDEWLLDYLGLDDSYLGASVAVDGSFTLGVWLQPVQLSHR